MHNSTKDNKKDWIQRSNKIDHFVIIKFYNIVKFIIDYYTMYKMYKFKIKIFIENRKKYQHSRIILCAVYLITANLKLEHWGEEEARPLLIKFSKDIDSWIYVNI